MIIDNVWNKLGRDERISDENDERMVEVYRPNVEPEQRVHLMKAFTADSIHQKLFDSPGNISHWRWHAINSFVQDEQEWELEGIRRKWIKHKPASWKDKGRLLEHWYCDADGPHIKLIACGEIKPADEFMWWRWHVPPVEAKDADPVKEAYKNWVDTDQTQGGIFTERLFRAGWEAGQKAARTYSVEAPRIKLCSLGCGLEAGHGGPHQFI